jgi:hypothetical protein
MDSDELKKRTKQFALRMLQLAESLPRTPSGRVLANQIAKCGTSVAANYRAACKGRSKSEFIAKLGIVEEEADESQFWGGNGDGSEARSGSSFIATAQGSAGTDSHLCRVAQNRIKARAMKNWQLAIGDWQ